MPLRDHFRSPVNDTHSWDVVHGQWPGEIVRHLTTILPAGFRAAPKVHLGSPFEVDKRRQLLDAWFYPIIVGQPLPTLPIWLTPQGQSAL